MSAGPRRRLPVSGWGGDRAGGQRRRGGAATAGRCRLGGGRGAGPHRQRCWALRDGRGGPLTERRPDRGGCGDPIAPLCSSALGVEDHHYNVFLTSYQTTNVNYGKSVETVLILEIVSCSSGNEQL